MRSGTPSHAVFVVALASTVTACGSDELFVPELTSTERLIEPEASARWAKDDQAIERFVVVGDLDGDGIDDALVRSYWRVELPDSPLFVEAAVYVRYGGAPTGKTELSTLPSLTVGGTFGFGFYGAGIASAGDVDGDGLADFLVGVGFRSGCRPDDPPADEEAHGGAYLVYGSRTRLTGATPIADAGVRLRDALPCTMAGRVAGLGDLDGDGYADFAISRSSLVGPTPSPSALVYYGRGARWSGTVDLEATADAVIHEDTPQDGVMPGVMSVGDADGDGYTDFLVDVALGPQASDLRLIRGAAKRLAGTVAPADIASTEFVDNGRCLAEGFGAALGDLDGDGFDDFSLVSCEWVSSTGRHRVFYGRAGGFPAQVGRNDADATIPMGPDGAHNLAAADLDGDGIADLIMGSPTLRDRNGGVRVIQGDGARLSGTVDMTGRGITYVGKPQRGTRCWSEGGCIVTEFVGTEIATGELTGDGAVDILVGATTNSFESPELGVHGSAYGHVYLLSPSIVRP